MEKLLTTGEIARRLGTTPHTVRSWITLGQLKAVRLPSGVYRVPESELDKILETA